MPRAHPYLLPLLSLVFACSGAPDPQDDAGTPLTNIDAGTGADSGPGRDAAEPADAGSPANDAATSADAGTNPSDASGPVDPLVADDDCDGLSNAYELSTLHHGQERTNPRAADSDGDGLPDGLELGITARVPGSACADGSVSFDLDPSSRTDPTVADSDGDSIVDGTEDQDRDGQVGPAESDPRRSDSDGDRLPDAVEDANRNGLVDPGETSAALRDTDGDGVWDGVEDRNLDGRRDADESDPLLPDTDGDGLLDGAEDNNHTGIAEPYETSALSPDTDCDGLADGAELSLGTSPISADTDGDGISDGIEEGVLVPVPGANCPSFVAAALPSTTTDPLDVDTDNDGIPDGVEDANRNGRQDAGETSATDPDSDGDTISDGDEAAVGANPLDPNEPSAGSGSGILDVCADDALLPLQRHIGADAGGDWTIATPTGFVSTELAPAGNPYVAALDRSQDGVAAFVLETPAVGSAALNLRAQLDALLDRFTIDAAQYSIAASERLRGRELTSHDGFETAVSGIIDLTSVSRTPAALRNAIVEILTGTPGISAGLPTNTGAPTTNYVLSYQLVVRDASAVVLGAILDRTVFDANSDPRRTVIEDLTNGTALSQRRAPTGKGCDTIIAGQAAIADFIWMADISGSTDDDRGRIANAAGLVFGALTANGVDFRMGVVRHINNPIRVGNDASIGAAGELYAPGFIAGDAPNAQANFIAALTDTLDEDGCEYGLSAVHSAIELASPRTNNPDPRRLRSDAVLAVVYVSDEFAEELAFAPSPQDDIFCPINNGNPVCDTGVRDVFPGGDPNTCVLNSNAAERACIDRIVQPFIDRIQSENGIAFAQVIPASPVAPCDTVPNRCLQVGSDTANEPGVGYLEVVQATGGVAYSPCVADPGAALTTIVDAVSAAASQFVLRAPPVSSTIKVGVTRSDTTTIVPRHAVNGFAYDPVANSIFFRGAQYRPAVGDQVTISYQIWQPPAACEEDCLGNTACDGATETCVCDTSLCDANCGGSEVCNADCECECPVDCGGACGLGQVCNQDTCACECADDCGGCPTGTACNQDTCACECETDCGGACDGLLACDSEICGCVCPDDCGGACGAGEVCDPASCACDCPQGCDEACPGASICDQGNGCGCVCPDDCGGCQDGSTCNQDTCACECSPTCDGDCPGNTVCDPANGCQCMCPDDCGGACGIGEICIQSTCECVNSL